MKPHLTGLAIAASLLISAYSQNTSEPLSPPREPAMSAPAADAPGAPRPAVTEKKTQAAKSTTQRRRQAGYPFRGKLKAADKNTMTLTIAGKEKDRVLHVTSQTRFMKEGKPATFEDALPETQVSGYAKTGNDGKLEAVTVNFGGKAAAKKTE